MNVKLFKFQNLKWSLSISVYVTLVSCLKSIIQ